MATDWLPKRQSTKSLYLFVLYSFLFLVHFSFIEVNSFVACSNYIPEPGRRGSNQKVKIIPSGVALDQIILGKYSTLLECAFAVKKFPEYFKFGAAGASYQIEGAWNEDGKGPSIWDNFVRLPGRIKNGQTGDIACDSYHKYQEDIELLAYLNTTSYRLSISWPRVLPNGTPNKINQAGIDYYINVVKELKAKGIEPIVTLYHWDLPQYLYYMGGWLNPQIADYFGDFARIIYKNLGPYVKYWITVNEPSSICYNGYAEGSSGAPGLSLVGDGIYQCAANTVRAHAKAYRIYDNEFRAEQGGKVTINVPSQMLYPKNTSDPRDFVAANKAFEFVVGLYTNPVFLGNWPQIVIDRVANRSRLEGYSFSRLPEFTQKEIDYINGTFDYFTLNMYTSSLIEHADDQAIGAPSYLLDLGVKLSADPSWPKSSTSWLNFDPKGIRHLLNWIDKKYNPGEIIITENGWSDLGEIDDQGRVTYLKGYLSNLLDAILEDGINVTGYTLWSLLDNFEWSEGYTQKFGIVHVDFDSPNRTRTLKSSAEWYKRVIAARAIVD